VLPKNATSTLSALLRPAWSIQGSITLQHRELLRIRDGRDLVIAVNQGEVWITQEGDRRDIELETGARYRLERDGISLVHALRRSELTLLLPLPDRSAPRVDLVCRPALPRADVRTYAVLTPSCS
jgi:hypothetical protein